jgi:hypothetical protein
MASTKQPATLRFAPSTKASTHSPSEAGILPISMIKDLRKMWMELNPSGRSGIRVTAAVVKSPCSSLITLGPDIVACHIADDLYLVMEAESTLQPDPLPQPAIIHRIEDYA